MWLPEEVFQQLAEVEVAHLTQANKYLEEFLSKTIRYNETPCKGSPKFGSHPLRDAEVEGSRTDRKLRAWFKQRKRPSGVAQDPVPLLSTEPDLSVSSERASLLITWFCVQMHETPVGRYHSSTHRDLGRPPTKDRSACKGLHCNCQSSRALP